MFTIPKLPLEDWINTGVDRLSHYTSFFDALSNIIATIANAFQAIFDFLPVWLFITLLLIYGNPQTVSFTNCDVFLHYVDNEQSRRQTSQVSDRAQSLVQLCTLT